MEAHNVRLKLTNYKFIDFIKILGTVAVWFIYRDTLVRNGIIIFSTKFVEIMILVLILSSRYLFLTGHKLARIRPRVRGGRGRPVRLRF